MVGAVAIDEMRSVFYAGSMGNLFGRFSAKVRLWNICEICIMYASRVIYEMKFVYM